MVPLTPTDRASVVALITQNHPVSQGHLWALRRAHSLAGREPAHFFPVSLLTAPRFLEITIARQIPYNFVREGIVKCPIWTMTLIKVI